MIRSTRCKIQRADPKQGKWMYSRADVQSMVKLIQTGMLKLNEENGIGVAGSFGLDEWQKAFDFAKDHAKMGQVVVFRP
jgi:hypothetical protein